MLANIRWSAVAFASALLAGGLTMWACSTPPRIGARLEFGPLSGGFEVGPGGETVAQVNGQAGICWKLVFVGSDGAAISTTTVIAPGASQVPAGTVRVEFNPVPCPESQNSAAPGSSGSPLASARALPFPSWHDVYSVPIDLTSVTTAICHARVWCGASQDPSAILRPILQAGPGSAVPPNVRIQFFADVNPSLLGATVRVAALEPILDMNVDWNHTAGFADLATGVNVVPGALPNGWSTVEFYVAETEVDLTPGYWNQAVMTYATVGQPLAEQYSLGFQAPLN